MRYPLVSIIIPTYDRGQIISEALYSVLAQTYKNWECIVVDDGSHDHTQELINSFQEKCNQISYHKRPEALKKGASACRNYGLKLSQGELIQFLDSDDLLRKNKLEEQVKLYSGDLTLFTCKWGGFEETKDLEKRFKYKYNSYRNFKNGTDLLQTFGEKDEFFPPHVYLTPRELIKLAGEWNEDLTNNDDAEFFTRVILSATKIKFTSKTSVYYRYSGSDKLSSFTTKARVLSAINSWKLIESHIQTNYPGTSVDYIENAKRFLKETIRKEYPELLEEEQLFFRKRPDSLFGKVKKHVFQFCGSKR